METLQIELRDDDDAIGEIRGKIGPNVKEVASDQFEGDVNVISMIVALTSATITVIGGIVKDHIASRKFIKVKYKGIEITGGNLKDIESFLNNIAKRNRDDK